MGHPEFTGGIARPAPFLEELSLLGEFDHAVVAGIEGVSVRDEDVPVGRHRDIAGGIEMIGPAPGDAGRAKGEQDLPLWAELHDLMAALAGRGSLGGHGVGDPHIAPAIDFQAVGPDEQAAAKAPDEVALQIEFQNGIQVGIEALAAKLLRLSCRAAHDDPEVLAVRIELEVTYRPHGPAGRHLRPIFDRAIRIRIGLREGPQPQAQHDRHGASQFLRWGAGGMHQL